MKESLYAMLLALTLASALATTLATTLGAQVQQPHTFTGRVVDENQQPIAGAEIRSMYGAPQSGLTQLGETSISDENGRYSIRNHSKPSIFDLYGLHLKSAGRGGKFLYPFTQPFTPGLADLGDIALKLGKKIPVFVRDEHGKPIEHATVQTSRDATWFFQDQRAGLPLAWQTTNAKGFAHLTVDRSARIGVEVRARGYYGHSIAHALPGQPLIITLNPASPIHGQLTDSEGHGVKGTIGVDWGGWRGAVSGGYFEVDLYETDSEGQFEIPRTTADPYRIHGRAEIDGMPYMVADVQRVDASTKIDLRLPSAKENKTMTVTVVDRAGKPVAGALVASHWLPRNYAIGKEQLYPKLAVCGKRTNAAGVVHLPWPRYDTMSCSLIIRAIGYQSKIVRSTNPGSQAVKLSPERVIEGVLLDSNGLPIKGAHISIQTSNFELPEQHSQFSSWSNDKGEFTITGLGKDTVDIKVWWQGSIRHRKKGILPKPLGKRILSIKIPDLIEVRGTIKGLKLSEDAKIIWVQVVPNYQPVQHTGMDSSFLVAAGGKYSATVTTKGLWRPQLDPGSGDLLTKWALPLGEVKVSEAGSEHNFDLSELGFGTLEFNLSATHPAMPIDRLSIVISLIGNIQFGVRDAQHFNSRGQLTGDLQAGDYHIMLIDSLTNLPLWNSEEPLTITANETLRKTVDLKLGRVVVRLNPPADKNGVRADKLVIAPIGINPTLIHRSLNLMTAGKEIELFAPLKDYELHFISSDGDLNTGKPSHGSTAVSTRPLRFDADDTTHIKLEWPTR